MATGLEWVNEPMPGDFLAWASQQEQRLDSGADCIDRQGLARLLRGEVETRRVEARDLVRRAITAMLLVEHGPRRGRAGRLVECVTTLDALSSLMGLSLSEELAAEYGRLYAAGAFAAAEVLRDVGGDPAVLPREPPWEWEDAFSLLDARSAMQGAFAR
jgi:hypothetical protein